MRERLAIVAGVRTPFCRMGSELAGCSADDLGRTVVDAVMSQTGVDPGEIDEVIFGCVAQPMDAANVARVIALRAGVPERVPAVTVHRNCASGFEAVTTAAERAAAGRGSLFLVGGAESMSRVPLLFGSRAAKKFERLGRARGLLGKLSAALSFRPGDFAPEIGLKLGLTDPVCGLNMGETAEVLAREFKISRERQDAFAADSHQKAAAAQARLDEEICAVFTPRAGELGYVRRDNGVRPDSSVDALAKLRPVFDRKRGTVTAGNSSQITDGGVALLVATESRAQRLGLEPLGYLAHYAYAGCDPRRMGLGPVFAAARLEEVSGWDLESADVVELNEAFAAQALAVLEALESVEFARRELSRAKPVGRVPRERLNVNGGAIALGHPVGATGARLVLTALKELGRRGGRRACVTACVGGGQGAALWLERN